MWIAKWDWATHGHRPSTCSSPSSSPQSAASGSPPRRADQRRRADHDENQQRHVRGEERQAAGEFVEDARPQRARVGQGRHRRTRPSAHSQPRQPRVRHPRARSPRAPRRSTTTLSTAVIRPRLTADQAHHRDRHVQHGQCADRRHDPSRRSPGSRRPLAHTSPMICASTNAVMWIAHDAPNPHPRSGEIGDDVRPDAVQQAPAA